MDQDWYDGNGEVLVILGGSMLVPGTGANATLGYDTYLRCVYAGWVLKTRHYRHVVVTGGDGLAEAMAAFLVKDGVAPASIFQERAAMNTYQNALYTRRLLGAEYTGRTLPPVVILTSDYHSWRARRVFEHCGLHAKTIPVPDLIKRSGELSYRWTAALTLAGELEKDVWYILSGKLT